jgi:disulfide bond formation protein DsbB
MSLAPRTIIAAFLALAIAVIGYVLFAQYVQGYQPCELCLRERLPWYVLLAVALWGVIRPSGVVLWLVGLALLVAAGLGAHHAGVELHWWPGPQACTGTSGANTVDELRRMLQATPVVRCDEIEWTFLGLSMADYNFLVSAAAAILALAAAWKLGGRAHRV